MKPAKLLAIFTVTLLSILSLRCTKEGDKKANCKLTRIKYQLPQGAYIDISYNNDGEVSTMHCVGIAYPDRTYNYFGNTIVITHGGPGNYTRDTIEVDDQGRPVNIYKYALVPWQINYHFEYNGDDLASVTVLRTISNIPYTATADYQSGNMVGYTYGGQTTSYEYYTDQDNQPGDFLNVVSMLEYGVSIYPNKNLVKGMVDAAGGITNYTYEFNDEGMISKVTQINGTSSSFITYQYQCE